MLSLTCQRIHHATYSREPPSTIWDALWMSSVFDFLGELSIIENVQPCSP